MVGELTQFGQLSEGQVARAERLKREVGSDIVAAAYLRGTFTLPSGQTSDYYFDKYLFETKPTILRRVAAMLAGMLPAGLDRVAGAGGGGVALAAAVSLETGLPFVILSPDSDIPLRGELHAGERVAVLADVVDSGSHVVRALDVVTSAGGSVAGVISVIDRDAGGTATISATGVHYQPLYRLAELGVDRSTPVRLDREAVMAALAGRPIPQGIADPFLDPQSVEQLGVDLAEMARDVNATRVMVWGHSDAIQLAHVVARELSVQIVRGVEGAGVIDVEGELLPGDRVLILDTGFRTSVRQMIALVRGRDAEPIAILTVTKSDDPEIDGVQVLSLEDD